MYSILSHNKHEQLKNFVGWTLNVSDGSMQGYSFIGGNELNWIEILEEFHQMTIMASQT